MTHDVRYYPTDGSYFAAPDTIYAQWMEVNSPNPCRKYHISSNVPSAKIVADTVLPMLVVSQVCHKVVKTETLLRSQMQRSQAGKFITLYMHSTVEHLNATIQEIAERLAALKAAQGIQPSPVVPRSRIYQHVFMEMPLDEGMFIYGGFVCDPGE